MYNGYLDKCMPSEAMRNYLKEQDLWVWEATAIITSAPVSINIKLEELKNLKADEASIRDRDSMEDCDNAINIIETALGFLDAEGIFTLEEVKFSYELKKPKWGLRIVCETMDEVKEYIKSEQKFYTPDAKYYRWYDVVKWMKDSTGKYRQASNYYYVENEIMYAFLEDSFIGKDHDLECLCYNGLILGELRLPVPFKAGDILEVDGYPFGPKFRMLILEVGDNTDCCCLQGLAKDEKGKWNEGAVKHGTMSWQYNPKLPYLYTAKYFEGKLSKNESILYEISECISGDEERGYRMSNAIYNIKRRYRKNHEWDWTIRGLTNKEMREAVEAMKKECI